MGMKDSTPQAIKKALKGYKPTAVGLIPEDWEVKPLREVAQIRSGIAKNSNALISDPILVHYLRVANVQDGFLDLSEMSRIAISRSDLNRFSVLPGDVLMNEGGDLDKLARGTIWNGEYTPCVHQNHVFVVRCGPTAEPLYLTNWSAGAVARRYFLVAGKQTTNLASINKTALGELPVAVPDTTEQRAIAAALSDVDGLIAALEKLIAKKRAIKQAAMQQLLTGRSRLPGFHGEWELKSLFDLADRKKELFDDGDWIESEHITTEGIRLIQTGNIGVGCFVEKDDKKYISETSFKALRCKELKHGDLLVCRLADPAGRACVLPDIGEDRIVTSVDVTIFRPSSQLANRIFLSQVFSTSEWFKIVNDRSGGTTHKRISRGALGRLAINVPPVPEQTAIATVLSDMDTEIEALERRRDETRQIKQGMMQQLLTGRIRLVKPQAAAVQADDKSKESKPHSWVFNEAVVISTLAKHFGKEEFPLGRKRYTKLSYLMHRHVEKLAEGYLKKAAGPYNPKTKYGGPEQIALESGYVREHSHGPYSGFVAANNIAQAESYFERWYGKNVIQWLEQFRFKKNDDLEMLATVDMAIEELRAAGKDVDVSGVKAVIRSHTEWKAKLDREVFSDTNIRRAIRTVGELFAEQG